jgi:hypothetical protein
MGLNYLLDETLIKAVCERLNVTYDVLSATSKEVMIKRLVRWAIDTYSLMPLMKGVYELLLEKEIPIPEPLKEAVMAGGAMLDSQPKNPARFGCDLVYTVLGSGEVRVDTHILPGEGLPFLPRAGLQMRLPEGFEQFSWYGRGPHETYVDRKEGAQVSVYHGTVDQQYVPYIVPEENGNKTDVRWASLANAKGIGLLVCGDRLLEVSVHHFTPEDLTVARHPHELVRRPETILNIDYGQSGLGSASCGPGRLEKYQLKPEEIRYRVSLRPY